MSDSIDFQESKKRASEFFKSATDCDADQIENGLKMLGISYLNLEANRLEEHQAQLLLKLAHKKYGEGREG